jgi:hypothetical protein
MPTGLGPMQRMFRHSRAASSESMHEPVPVLALAACSTASHKACIQPSCAIPIDSTSRLICRSVSGSEAREFKLLQMLWHACSAAWVRSFGHMERSQRVDRDLAQVR